MRQKAQLDATLKVTANAAQSQAVMTATLKAALKLRKALSPSSRGSRRHSSHAAAAPDTLEDSGVVASCGLYTAPATGSDYPADCLSSKGTMRHSDVITRHGTGCLPANDSHASAAIVSSTDD